MPRKRDHAEWRQPKAPILGKNVYDEKTATSATQSLYITISQRITDIVRVAVGSSRGAEKCGLACRFLPIPPAALAERLRPHFAFFCL